MSLDINLTNVQSKPIVVSANQTAENDRVYHVIANATFTDPTGVNGKGYEVFVRNGTATINSVAYTEGTTILRLFHSGAWVSYLGGGSQNLQQVTDIGSETTSSIVSLGGFVAFDDFSSPDNYSVLNSNYLELGNNPTGEQLFLNSNIIQFSKTGTAIGTFKATNVINFVTLEFPNKTTGSYTIATTADIPSVTGLVPYTGATQNVDLGEYELKAGQVEFDQTPTGTAGVAVMRWNDTDGTVDLGLKGGNVTLQLGQEQLVRVVNKTATNINLLEANYQAVRVTGAQGQRLKVDLAQATNDVLSAETIGLVTETINNNQEGFITTSGLVRGINTTGSLQGETWSDGDVVYLSATTAGRITNVKPSAPNHLVIIGYVVSAHATQGSIFVKVDNGYKLDELHNVAISTPLNNQSLVYETATTLWKNKALTASDVGAVATNSAITGATKTKITYDAKGLVTAGADATTADIADSSNKRYVTDANLTVIGNTSNTNTGDETQSSILAKLGFVNKQQFGGTVTGTTSETIVHTYSFSANELSANTILHFETQFFRVSPSANGTFRLKLNTSNTLVGSVQLATNGMGGNTSTFASVRRKLTISGGNIIGFPPTTSVASDLLSSAIATLSNAIDVTQPLWFFVTYQPSGSGDSATCSFSHLKNF
jgi:hypothetical protein